MTDIEIGDYAGVKVGLPPTNYLHEKVAINSPNNSGSMALACHALSVKHQMSLFAPKPSSPATLSTVPSKNTASPKLLMSLVFLRNAILRPSRPFSAPVSPSTRDSRSREPDLARPSPSLVLVVDSARWLASTLRLWVWRSLRLMVVMRRER